MSHLETIATRQRKSLLRDLVFAVAVAITAVVSFSSVSTAARAANATPAATASAHFAQR